VLHRVACVLALAFSTPVLGCASDGSGERVGASTSGNASAGPTGDASGGGDAGSPGDGGTDGTSEGSTGVGSSGFGSSGFGSSGFGSSGFGSTGGGVALSCADLAQSAEVVHEVSGNGVFGGVLEDLDHPADELLLEFGDAASQSCLGMGTPACAPAGATLPSTMFQFWVDASLLTLGSYVVGFEQEIGGAHIESTAQEPECFANGISASLSGTMTLTGFTESSNGELLELEGYFCDWDDSPNEVWHFTTNICG